MKFGDEHIGGREIGENAGVRIRYEGPPGAEQPLVNLGRAMLGDLKSFMQSSGHQSLSGFKQLNGGIVVLVHSILGDDGFPDHDDIHILSTGGVIKGAIAHIIEVNIYCSSWYPLENDLVTGYPDWPIAPEHTWVFIDPYQTSGASMRASFNDFNSINAKGVLSTYPLSGPATQEIGLAAHIDTAWDNPSWSTDAVSPTAIYGVLYSVPSYEVIYPCARTAIGSYAVTEFTHENLFSRNRDKNAVLKFGLNPFKEIDLKTTQLTSWYDYYKSGGNFSIPGTFYYETGIAYGLPGFVVPPDVSGAPVSNLTTAPVIKKMKEATFSPSFPTIWPDGYYLLTGSAVTRTIDSVPYNADPEFRAYIEVKFSDGVTITYKVPFQYTTSKMAYYYRIGAPPKIEYIEGPNEKVVAINVLRGTIDIFEFTDMYGSADSNPLYFKDRVGPQISPTVYDPYKYTPTQGVGDFVSDYSDKRVKSISIKRDYETIKRVSIGAKTGDNVIAL